MRPSNLLAVLAVVVASSAASGQAVAPKAVPQITIQKWVAAVQKLGSKYHPADTNLATDIKRDELIAAIAKQFDGVVIEFKAKVKDVRFNNGTALVKTEPEMRAGWKPSKDRPIRVNRSQPIELAIGKEETAKIMPGAILEFRGLLKFHPRRWGLVGHATKSQQLYDLRHEYLKGGYIGTFTATKCECKIGGKAFACVWAK